MSQMSVDLTNCDQEPIHIPGAIQPHGALLALRRSDFAPLHVSENVEALLGASIETVLRDGLPALLDDRQVDRIHSAFRETIGASKPVYLLTVQMRNVADEFDAIAHVYGDVAIVEFEPARGRIIEQAPELYRQVQLSITRMQQAPSLKQMYQSCADDIRRLAGFDRVMVYRFDVEFNGVVIAEAKRDDLEPFVGLHYPASDIPKQARELYKRNWLRFIADRDYVPARVLPTLTPGTLQPLDMSFAVLRSVSPIHLEYLRNMGVGASMSISLLKDGELWGLIACHHYSPRYVPYDIRTGCELLGQVMSLNMTTREGVESTQLDAAMAQVTERLITRLDDSDVNPLVLTDGRPSILDLVPAMGVAVVVGDDIQRAGQTPGGADLRFLSDFIERNAPDGIYSTDAVGDAIGSSSLSAIAAGVLAISVSAERRVQIMWFRPEQIRTVDWAGDPAKSVVKGDLGVRLSPRGSFALWKQTVRGRSAPWTPAERLAASDFRDRLARQLLRRAERLARRNQTLMLAGLERERQLDSERTARSNAERLNRMKDEFLATLSHELRTPLNAILGWTQLLVRGEATGGNSPEEMSETLEIIERNARVQSQMIEDLLDVSRITSGKLRLDVQTIDLASIVEAAIGTTMPAANAKNIRVRTTIDPLLGIDIKGDPQRLQQILWNLLSNAVKFTPKGGSVQVVLERVNSHVEISVSDSGQGIARSFLPHVFDRFRQEDAASTRKHGGLGLGLAIVRNLVELHGGTVQADSPGEGQGATFVVSLPIQGVRDRSTASRIHPTTSRGQLIDCETLNLKGLRILVVDDEPDAREFVRRLMEECDAVVTLADSSASAMAHLEREPFDVMVSDIGMPGEDGYKLMERLRAYEAAHRRPRMPAVALTAYARPEDRRAIMLAGFQMHVAKPVEASELTAVVASLAGRI